MAMFMYSLVVVWFHRTGHQFMRFPFRPWIPEEGRTLLRGHVSHPEAAELRGTEGCLRTRYR